MGHCFRKNIFNKIGLFDPNTAKYSDRDIFIRFAIAQEWAIGIAEKPLWYHYFHNKNLLIGTMISNWMVL